MIMTNYVFHIKIAAPCLTLAAILSVMDASNPGNRAAALTSRNMHDQVSRPIHQPLDWKAKYEPKTKVKKCVSKICCLFFDQKSRYRSTNSS